MAGAWGVLLGTAVQLQQAQLWPLPVYACMGLLAFAGLAWVWRQPLRHAAWLWLGLCALLAFAQTGVRASGYDQQALASALEGQTLQVVGVVAQMPQRMDDSIRFRLDVERAYDSSGHAVRLPPRVLLSWYGRRTAALSDAPAWLPADVQAGERWRFAVRLKAPHGHINPHGFDYELWLWEQNLQATGYVRQSATDPAPQRLDSTWQHPLERWRQQQREAISQQVDNPALAGVVAALWVGDQSAIERADWDVFRATGVAHLMAISGLHITGLAWLVAQCVGWLWRRSDVWAPQRPWALRWPAPTVAAVSAVVVALLYALFTGWGLPAQRTVWMLGVVTLLRVQGLRWPLPVLWLVVCAVVVAIDPWGLLQAGFWLSFVAVGVLFASGSDVRLPHAEAHSTWQRVRRAAARLWHEQWLMSVCLAPLSLLVFHQVSVVGLVANLLAVPWVTLLVTPLCALGAVWPLAWIVAAWALQGLMSFLSACASVSWAQWSAPAAPLWAGAAAVWGLALVAWRGPVWVRLMGVVWVCPVLSWQAERPAVGAFELLAADMGQGHAVLLRTATHSLLYDTGPRYSAETDAGQRVLVPLLRALGERLNTVVISHQDSDHSGGALAVMAMQPQAEVLTSIPPTHSLQQAHPMTRCERGQAWVWDDVHFEVLHPTAEDYGKPLKPNALSCVLRVRSASGAVALLVADIEAAQEQQLLRTETSLTADWLLVPHHGSLTSSTPAFVQAVQPSVAVVQAGYRNRFGHPRPEVVARYDAQGVLMVQSARCGASVWRSDEPKLVQCERDQGKRYWHQVF